MNLRFKIERLFYKLGYSAPESIPTPDRLYNRLIKLPLPILEYELKKSSKRIRKFQDHAYYDKLLRKFIPSWDIPSEGARFIGKGFGVNCLNTYRKIEKEALFEKVYFSTALDLKNHEWALSNIVPDPNFSFDSPAIKKIKRGEILTAVYFSYCDLQKAKPTSWPAQLIKVSKELYKISSGINPEHLPQSLYQSFLVSQKDFAPEMAVAKNRLKTKGIDTDYYDDLVQNSRKVYTHGDLTENNVFQGNILIDWDYFGLYPIGTDVQKIIIRLKRNNVPMESLENWLEKHYRNTVDVQEWSTFKANVFYLLHLNTFVKYNTREFYKELEGELIEGLQKIK